MVILCSPKSNNWIPKIIKINKNTAAPSPLACVKHKITFNYKRRPIINVESKKYILVTGSSGSGAWAFAKQHWQKRILFESAFMTMLNDVTF